MSAARPKAYNSRFVYFSPKSWWMKTCLFMNICCLGGLKYNKLRKFMSSLFLPHNMNKNIKLSYKTSASVHPLLPSSPPLRDLSFFILQVWIFSMPYLAWRGTPTYLKCLWQGMTKTVLHIKWGDVPAISFNFYDKWATQHFYAHISTSNCNTVYDSSSKY